MKQSKSTPSDDKTGPAFATWFSYIKRLFPKSLLLINGLLAILFLLYGEFFIKYACYAFFALFLSFSFSAFVSQGKDDSSDPPRIKPFWKGFLLSAFIVAGYVTLFLEEEFWLAHWRFITLSALSVPALLFIRQNWNGVWRDNRWIILPAVMIALWWVNSSWTIAYQNSKKWETVGIYPDVLTDNSLRIAYQRYIPFDQVGPSSISLWCDDDVVNHDCSDRRLILSSPQGNLLFSKNTNPPVWKSKLIVELDSHQREQQLYVMQATPGNTGRAEIQIEWVGKTTNIPIGTFESETDAQTRAFWLTLLKEGNLAATVVGVLYAAFKQREEKEEEKRKSDKKEEEKRKSDKKEEEKRKSEVERENQEKQTVLALLQDIPYQTGAISHASHAVQNAIEKWDESVFRRQLKNVFAQWIKKTVQPNWRQEVIATGQDDFLRELGDAWRELDGTENQTLVQIQIQQKGYNPLDAAVHYPSETYPLQKKFQQRVETDLASYNKGSSFGPEDWGLFANPFGDWQNPFAYGKTEGAHEDFSMLTLAPLAFSFSPERFLNQTYYFARDWDVQVALYVFCAQFYTPPYLSDAQTTLFVPVIPKSWQNGQTASSYLLACLAERWLEILTNVPRVVDELSAYDQERLASLLVWRYRSAAVIKHKVSLAELKTEPPLIPVSRLFLAQVEKTTPQPDLTGDELLQWLSLRPAKTWQTMFLCTDVSLSPASPGRLSNEQAKSLRAFSSEQEEAMLAAGISFARFWKARSAERRYTTQITDKDSVLKWLDARVEHCSQEKSTKRVFNALFPMLDVDDLIRRAQGSPGRMLALMNFGIEPYVAGTKDASELEFIDPDSFFQ